MSVFREFEQQTLRWLCTEALGAKTVETLIAEAGLASYHYSGSGYYLTVRHPALAQERQVCASPLVTGRCGDIESGFVVFLEAGELTLECHTWGSGGIPEGFRDQPVQVRVSPD